MLSEIPPNDHALEAQPAITPWKNDLLQLAKSGAQLSRQQPIAQTCGVALSLGDYCQSLRLEQSECLKALGPALSE